MPSLRLRRALGVLEGLGWCLELRVEGMVVGGLLVAGGLLGPQGLG